MSSHMQDKDEFYDRIHQIDIGDVARKDLTITDESGPVLYCDPPCHKSQSHRSFHVDREKQLFYCFACGHGGGVIQLLELIQSGQITRGICGSMTETHRQARDSLAAMVGLPPL